MNIYQKINKVMTEVDYIQKDRKIDGGGQKYNAVSYDNVIAQIRKSIVANGIVIVARQIDGKIEIPRDVSKDIKMHLYSGRYEIDFVNIEKPEDKVTITVESHAADNGDKAPGKAITYATKTAILKVFSLETGDDEESRTFDHEQDAKTAYDSLVVENMSVISNIKTGIANQDLAFALESWRELSQDVQAALWKAPTKGGIFTTAERATMKTTEFRTALDNPMGAN
jgi:hypothetical protein